MSLVLSETVDSDFDRLMEIQFAAFGQTGDSHREPMIDVMFPGGDTPAGQAAARDRTLEALHSDPTAVFLKVTDSATGEIVGGAKWKVHPQKPVFKQIEVDFCEGEEKEFTELVMNFLYRGRVEKMGPDEGPYLFLDIIFTDPKHQSRGAGSMLVKWGVDRADEMGVEACLEATRFGRPVYEKFGFHATEQVVVPMPEKWADKPKLGYLIMQRPAVKKSA